MGNQTTYAEKDRGYDVAEINLFQYRVGTTLIHRMHPTLKILLILLISIQVTYGNTYNLIYYVLLILIYRRGLSRSELYYGLYITLTLTLFQSISIKEFNIQVLFQSLIYSLRFIIVISMGNLFISTTRPESISQAIYNLLRNRKLSENISLSLRTFPIFIESWKQCHTALKARNFYNRKNPFYRLTWISIPLLIETFKKSHDISLTLETRCYSGWIPEEITDRDINKWVIIIILIPYLLQIGMLLR